MRPSRSMTCRRCTRGSPSLDSVTALALRFTILTVARAGEVTGARWSEFDIEAKVWTVPSDRIKAGKTHRVPLSREAMEILARVHTTVTDTLVFPGWVTGKPLSHFRDAEGSAGGRRRLRDGARIKIDVPRLGFRAYPLSARRG